MADKSFAGERHVSFLPFSTEIHQYIGMIAIFIARKFAHSVTFV